MTTFATVPARGTGAGRGTALRTGAVAGVTAAAANLMISAAARGPLGAGNDFIPLTPGPIVMWSLVGVLLGAAGWRLIVNRSNRSRAVLKALVPTVLIISLMPDFALLATDAVPGQTVAGVLALMVMHVVTTVIAVGAYSRRMPTG